MPNTTTLNQNLENMMDFMQIEGGDRNPLLHYKDRMMHHHLPTAEHSVRTAGLCIEIALFTRVVHPNALFYPGLLHDVGKLGIRRELLEEGQEWNSDKAKEMAKHITFGFDMLKNSGHIFSAYITAHYHRFAGTVPEYIPKWPADFSEGKKATILYCARLVGIADAFDALTSRKHAESGQPLSRKEAKHCLIAQNKDQGYLIEQLYSAEIF